MSKQLKVTRRDIEWIKSTVDNQKMILSEEAKICVKRLMRAAMDRLLYNQEYDIVKKRLMNC